MTMANNYTHISVYLTKTGHKVTLWLIIKNLHWVNYMEDELYMTILANHDIL